MGDRGFSTGLANAMLDHVFGGPNYTRLSNVYAAAWIGDPGTTASGGAEVPNAADYARVEIANNDTNFPGASGQAKTTGTAITFPVALGEWAGTGSPITHIAFFSSGTYGSGAYLGRGKLATAKAIEIGDQLIVPAGEFHIDLIDPA